MRDLALQASGALAIFVAIIHGAIAELRERRERADTVEKAVKYSH
jgi:hypothetical protein